MHEVEELKQTGLSVSAISEMTGYDRKTVRKYLLEPEAVPTCSRRAGRPSKLDPHKPHLRDRLTAGVWNAQVLLREIRQRGFGGGYTILKDWLLPQRAAASAAAVRRFETPAGKQAHVDWGHLGNLDVDGRSHQIWGFTITLGYSRRLWAQAALDQKLGTLLRMHEAAFQEWGAVPEEILYDRMKTVWLGNDERGEVVWHPVFLDFAPGAMAGSTPLQQWRQAGRWPECLDRIWSQLEQRLGKSAGTREMITLVRAGSVSGWGRLIVAMEEALRLGVTDAAAVLHILNMPDPEERRRHAIALTEELAEFERPMPVMDEYDLLLNDTPGGHPMKSQTESLEHASVRQYCKAVRMPVIGANFLSLAEQAVKEKHSHIRYLEALLAMECEERDRHAISNRIRDAQLPRMKTLEEFDFAQAPQISAARIRELAEGGYVERSEPIVLIGEAGTGKSHLATGLCVAACRQKRRVRFTIAAALVNELVEAKQNNQVRRLMNRWQRYQLIALDEVGYVPLADIGAEFLFQVISDRAEGAALIITTNLPFSEWTTVFPNPRLCKALLDRIADRAHIIETGTESFRFRRTMERRKKP